MSSSRKKSRKGSSSRRHDAPVDEWKQYTSPDGHPYYYNAATKESRWELPVEEEPVRPKHRRPKGSRQFDLTEENSLKQESLNQDEVPKVKKNKKTRPESRKSATEEASNAVKPKNAMFQKLQASLEGKLNGPMMGMGRPPPMLNIRQKEEVEEETKTPSLEEQYEAETAGMSAAERLRFLRKKRQENMMNKRESIAGDDFMAEVANNMKKKGVTVKSAEKQQNGSEKRSNWEEQEQAEEQRKRQQMQDEMEAKEKEEQRKQREQQAKELEQRREQERAEQLEIEQRRDQERKQLEEDRKNNEEKKTEDHHEELSDSAEAPEPDVRSRSSTTDRSVVPLEDSDASSPEREAHSRRNGSQGSKHGSSQISELVEQQENVDDHAAVENGHKVESENAADSAREEKERAREERRARRKREKELTTVTPISVTSESPRRKSVSSSNGQKEEPRTRSPSSVEAEEEARAREKQLRRERRRMAKMEAALAAQSLESNGEQGDAQHEKHSNGSNDSSGSGHAGVYPMNGQPVPGQAAPGQPPFSGGMYPQYPYAMMPPPPPPPYGYYYPYMQPPMPMPVYPPSMVPPGYQLVPPTPPPSADGMPAPSALVPYGADSTLANAYGMNIGGMYRQQSAPELSRCDCCKGIGVGLVEKNGVCAHCNRLRLAFIVDSAQMRQRCSVCGGWGFQLLQANGMCEHCTRQTAQKSKAKVVTEAATRRSVAAPPRRNSTRTTSKNDGLNDIDWDKSSDDSDWDD
ncbi:hypothetical protein L915_20666 [Phytophthora nicotianae]|uniref:WW domain-containing protein n=2 Tax=Phytophthora nicotianae TaxID=4792 RepID=W2PHZ6_PHYN3|nr:hypothetical protein PPTG_18632 [Phytophthora nicotianae INRA-310]ETK72187.1 hypothetical protein L915_20666 [Phytophthora nicotianae]ETM99823.1 hypothetical protein PPTG_18632 [Phytophthora nicotianae INRA-310]KUF94703.1 Elicitin protein [Phytophthora nicotianae]